MRISAEEYKNLAKKKNKYGAVKVKYGGITFDSKMEYKYYLLLKADPTVKHIDVHVNLTLLGSVKFKLDFLIWKFDGKVEAHEVKGQATEGFKIKQKIFNTTHPLAPLIVVREVRGKWKVL